MFWKTSLPLLIILIDSDTHIISEEIKAFIFLIVSIMALSYWINRISADFLQVKNITWNEYLKFSYQCFIQGFKKK